MAKKDVVQETKLLMQSLRAKKAEELTKIDNESAEVRGKLSAAEQAMSEAQAALDPEAYNHAKAEAEQHKTTLQMYTSRREQITRAGLIPETESDSVIDSLCDYQKARNDEFRSAVTEHFAQLEKIMEAYKAGYDDVSRVVDEWTETICANHRTTYTQKDGSNRSKGSVPVTGQLGFFPERCEEINVINVSLKRIKTISEGCDVRASS